MGGNQKLSLFFVSYVGINIKNFAVGISRWSYFLASEYGTYFFTCYSHESRNTKRTLYLRHRTNKLRKNKSRHACSQRAQLLGVTPHELGGQKLAEILSFYVGQKISGRIYASIGLKLLIQLFSNPHCHVLSVQRDVFST